MPDLLWSPEEVVAVGDELEGGVCGGGAALSKNGKNSGKNGEKAGEKRGKNLTVVKKTRLSPAGARLAIWAASVAAGPLPVDPLVSICSVE